jgi:K+-transporting ATPase ATPase C chain
MKTNSPSVIQLRDGDPAEAPAIADGGILHHLRVSIVATIVLAVICCGFYPLIVWGLSQAIFRDKANGSLIRDASGQVVGSKLIGQAFSDAKYFHPRPSAAAYDATASGGSNLGPTSAKLFNGTTKSTTLPATKPGDPAVAGPDAVDYDGIKLRVLLYCQENNIPVEASWPLKGFMDDKGNYDQVKLVKAFSDDRAPLTFKASVEIPADAVTASASGLDPHISFANAKLQITRVASARKISPATVEKLIDENTNGRDLGILGEPGVNVLGLNLALDHQQPATGK